MNRYILIFLLFIGSFVGKAQNGIKGLQTENQFKTSMDSMIHQSALLYLGEASRAGLSVGIYGPDFLATYHYGTTHKGKNQLPTNETVYEIGSISKTFTGTLLAQAVLDGKMKLDDDIRLYLKEDYPNLEFQGQPIRLSHLVSHISGLPNFLPDNPSLLQNTSQDSLPFVLSRVLNEYTKQDFLNDLNQVKLDTIPGYKFNYSNSGPQLLKYILEDVYQMSFNDLLKRFLLKPLKMKATTSSFERVDLKNLAEGYNSKGRLTPYIPENLDAAGGIFSTVSDMLEYLKFHLDEENEVVSLSHQVTVGDLTRYAIGLNWQEVLTPGNHKKIWQSGGTFGFSSYGVLYPELGIAIVLLTNEADTTAQTDLGHLADRIFEKLYAPENP
ncbi:class A beta-lactamase-related serine hydrolase [Algoriphagus lacus]|uniref:Beta-lactamase n=1 Tax=Algoriphagus lacus TaxID=2056311 RepID=A0A418PNV0_9BACT|nr:serine hydrolase domain-containing protein [Algoriphagus lacus]RIW13361.1 class A beta-lactamase-related serine hydrolase [Algoriphagus lacus]